MNLDSSEKYSQLLGKMDEKGRKLNNNARLGSYQKLSDSQSKISLEYLSKVFRNLWIIGYFCFVFPFIFHPLFHLECQLLLHYLWYLMYKICIMVEISP